jgi:RimJ/RimL family protein N-acetyltransferase
MTYAILPRYRGRGLATEAAKAAADWAERHDVGFYASVRPPNPASVRVLTKIGMRLADSYFDEDGQRDIYVLDPASRQLSDLAEGSDASLLTR